MKSLVSLQPKVGILLLAFGVGLPCSACHNEARTKAKTSPSAGGAPAGRVGICAKSRHSELAPLLDRQLPPIRERRQVLDVEVSKASQTRFRVWEHAGGQRAELVRAGRSLFALDEPGIDIETAQLRSRKAALVGHDITGTGNPNLVLRAWSGGAHCCYTLYVLELGEPPCLLDVLPGDHYRDAYFEDVDGDGVLEFIGRDAAWHHFGEHYTWSLEPALIYRWDGERYRLAGELMQKPAPSNEQLDVWAAEIRNGQFAGRNCPPELCVLQAMLELHYTGHPKQAWQFFARATDEVDAAAFRREFAAILAQSKGWSELGW